jgi:type IV secretory pathway TrbF-like protein
MKFRDHFLTKSRPTANNFMLAHSTENPYLAARREWNERYGDYLQRMKTWQLTAFVSIGVSGVLAVALAYVASQSRIQPYVVEVDKSGKVTVVGPAGRGFEEDKRITSAQLAEFIQNARSVTADTFVQKRWLDKVYSLSSASAVAFLNDYFRVNDPFSSSKSTLISVDVSTVLPLSQNSWQVEWQETRRGNDGLINGKTHWQAILGVEFFVPKTPEEFMSNPTGMLLNSISWSQQL